MKPEVHASKRFATASAVLLLLGLCLAAMPAQAQEQKPEIVVLTSVNKPLASLQDAATASRLRPPLVLYNEVPNFHFGKDNRAQKGGPGLTQDPLRQLFAPTVATNVLTQFDGADNTDNGVNVTPPDTDGDVSGDAVDRYMQMINIVTTVFDKSGTELGGGAFFSSAFWAGFGGLCQTNDNGDPIVLYDETNQRWFVSQFAFNTNALGDPIAPFIQCIAVSQTSDPLGAYNRYAFDFTGFGFNDYPKFGFTTESITVMANLFIPPNFFFGGTFIGVADKNCIYAGTPSCTLVGTNLGGNEFGFLAGDLDDAAGTAGFVPALFGTAMTANGLFDVWEIVPDFVTPANTTITRIERVPIASFDSDICPATRERCIPHPGSGDDLEVLSGRLMHRLQLHDFGTHLSMVAAHSIDVDAAPPGGNGRAGIRWYELRSTDGGANWSLHQEGTHDPGGGLDRWMPSIAMNAAGDIGIGYMVSSASTPVEIRVTGQTAGTSGSGAFDGDEEVCRAGVAGADWTGRSGDYSATNVDPDSDTFWHTNEFGRSTVFRGWGTAVCEFSLGGGPINQPPVVTITSPPDPSTFNQGAPVTFAGTAIDPEDGTISASLSWDSDLDGNIGSGAGFTTSTLSLGTHEIIASVTDSGGLSGADTVTVTITPVGGGTNQLETVVVASVSSAGWTLVGTANTYTSMVAVCTPVYGNNTVPLVVRMQNAGSGSFEIMLQNPSGTAVNGEDVHCLVVEEGTWALPDGRALEAQKYNSTVTDQNNSWVGEAQTYNQSYTSPVVLGQVMTTNDPGWSVFWDQGTARTNPPSATALTTGKTVAEDVDVTRDPEDIGFVVIEAGIGTASGTPYEAALGSDTILGVGDNPPYSYTFSQSFSGAPDVAIATQAAMDGGNGGWAVLFGASPLSATQVDLAIDEDQIGDAERNHTTEQVAYLVFGQNVDLPLTGPNQPPVVTITSPPDPSTFNQGDPVTFAGTAIDPEDGTISASLSWDSDLDGNIGSGAGFMTSTLSLGTHEIIASVTDSGGLSGADTVTVTINAVAGNALETVTVRGINSADWTTVNLSNTYTSMVVVCTPVYSTNTIPEVVRMQNAAGSSFEIRLQNPSNTVLESEVVHCLAMEEGAGQLPDGRNIEAQKYSSTVTDENNSWVAEAQTYINSYTNPIVLGQVMTFNDPDWSVFWDQGSSRTTPPSATALRTGKHVGEDTDNTRSPEDVGFIVIEAGTGSLGGIPYEAALGSDIVRGVTNAPPYSYTFSQSFSQTPAVAIATLAAMDGGDGGWAILFGASPLSTTQIDLAIDEDQIGNTERNHTTEQVAYLVFEQQVNTTFSAPNPDIVARDGELVEAANTLSSELPEDFTLTDVYPNPFNQQVTIRYGMPETAHVRIMIFNVLGQHVATLVDGQRSEGYKTVVWDGRHANGSTLSSGVYIIRLDAGASIQTRNVLYVR